MFIENLHLTLRRFGKQKFNTSLHIIGLTLGMSVCLLIGLFLRYELNFDAWHENADRIYRINSVWKDGNEKTYHYSTPLPLANAMRTEISGLEHIALAHPKDNAIIEINAQKRFKQEHLLIVEPEILDIFNIDVILGDGHAALQKPYQALLTGSTAKKFFGDENPIGKTFIYENEFIITVAGVIRDLPYNTHLPATMLLSYIPDEKFLNNQPGAWSHVSGTSTYVVLPSDFGIKNLEVQLKSIADKNINSDPRVPKGSRSDFSVQRLRDIHFDSKYAGGGQWVKAVNASWLWFFASIGLAVLILACINFINLSTAQALTRAKEVGVRKTMGAGRFQLITQFLREAWTLSFVAGILSVLIAKAGLPYMNNLLDTGITFNLTQSPELIIALALGIILTGLLAGLYPAWIIARFNPVASLKSGTRVVGDNKNGWLRNGLVVIQFSISAGLLIAVVLIAQQAKYLHSKSLGFDKDNIITVELKGADNNAVFANALKGLPQVKDFSFAIASPSSADHWGTNVSLTDAKNPNRINVTPILADEHYFEMYGLKLLSGRFLQSSDTNYNSASLSYEQQVNKVVVNEKFVKTLGLGTDEDAIGKRFWFGMESGKAEIVGVIEDFNTTSLHDAIQPVLITQNAGAYGQAGIKVAKGSDFANLLTALEAAWKKAFPEGVFEYKFLDEQIDVFYKAEARLYGLFKIFAALAMLISCLGLWGLTTLAAQQRTKEIGIRKVLGASVSSIVVLLSKDFLKLVGVAFAIASPVVWYFMNQWLQDFAYKINISWWVFALAGFSVVLIALFTVSLQSIKAALVNPAQSLKTE